MGVRFGPLSPRTMVVAATSALVALAAGCNALNGASSLDTSGNDPQSADINEGSDGGTSNGTSGGASGGNGPPGSDPDGGSIEIGVDSGFDAGFDSGVVA